MSGGTEIGGEILVLFRGPWPLLTVTPKDADYLRSFVLVAGLCDPANERHPLRFPILRAPMNLSLVSSLALPFQQRHHRSVLIGQILRPLQVTSWTLGMLK